MHRLLQMVTALIARLDALHPRADSGEWYLLNNLLRFKEAVESSPSQQELEVATHVLRRFNVDSMDWNDPLFKETSEITEQAGRVAL